MKTQWISMSLLALIVLAGAVAQGAVTPIAVGAYPQEISTQYGVAEGLPSETITCIALDSDGAVYAGTDKGLAVFSGSAWAVENDIPAEAVSSVVDIDGMLVVTMANGESYYRENGYFELTPVTMDIGASSVAAEADQIYAIANGELFQIAASGDDFWKVDIPGSDAVRDVALNWSGQAVVAAENGLFLLNNGSWIPQFPKNETYSWAPTDVRAVAYDNAGRLWFASPYGTGCLQNDVWTLYTGKEGLPYDDFTVMTAGESGVVWFGTKIGAIRFDGSRFEYRQGRRWLADDQVNGIAVDEKGNAWIATPKGVSLIERKAMTFAEKAKFFEDEIDKYHRRTEYGFVLGVSVPEAGVKENWKKHDSDNDGLWSCMYGAGECYAYAATKDPLAKKRADDIFKAMKFLNEVTQGGEAPAPKGFVARTVLPTSGKNPNDHDTPANDMRKQEGDRKWKVMYPRWPKSEDGKWYWKTDTSSDELDGHYFFYSLYYDLVCETEEEKRVVRDHVRALTDHLIINEFCLVDHDGQPTRWSIFGPNHLNKDSAWWADRGINSLTILSFLAVADHMTGDTKYRAMKNMLIEEEYYAQNLQFAKWHRGPGTGNQSDDEMAFMNFYNLIRYEKDQDRKEFYTYSFYRYWRNERPECSPLFNFLFNAVSQNTEYTDIWGTSKVYPQDDEWLADSVDYLKRYAIDRFNWRQTNTHRKDITFLPDFVYGYDEDGRRRDRGYLTATGKVLPIDERYTGHWNHNPWSMDGGGDGRYLTDGAAYLLPYYMGLYHGFITD